MTRLIYFVSRTSAKHQEHIIVHDLDYGTRFPPYGVLNSVQRPQQLILLEFKVPPPQMGGPLYRI